MFRLHAFIVVLIASLVHVDTAPVFSNLAPPTAYYNSNLFSAASNGCTTQNACSILAAHGITSAYGIMSVTMDSSHLSMVQQLLSNPNIVYAGTAGSAQVNGNNYYSGPTATANYASSSTLSYIVACNYYTGGSLITPTIVNAQSYTAVAITLANTSYATGYAGVPPGFTNFVSAYNSITSVAMDASNNVYYTIVGSSTNPTSIAYPTGVDFYLWMLPATNYGQAKYTGISTCAYVFSNNANVYCLGSAGLIRVV